MPFELFEMQARIKGVEREFVGVDLAVGRLLGLSRRDPTELSSELRVRDIEAASTNLEKTYVIRIYSEFESVLRSYWNAAVRSSHPMMEILLNRLASRRRVPTDLCDEVHRVRVFRNSLVHGGEECAQTFTISEARGIFCRYFAFLPYEW